MLRHLHLHHCILSECFYAEVNALVVQLHKLHGDITEPTGIYPSYQHTSVIKKTYCQPGSSVSETEVY